PDSVTIPAGSASTTMTINAVANTTGADPETVVLTLSPDAAYLVGSPNSATMPLLAGSTLSNPPPTPCTTTSATVSAVHDTTLQLPKAGDNILHVLSPTLLELCLINTKQPDPARVPQWDFVNSSYQFQGPSLSEFAVTANGQPVSVQSVGFKRRPLYAPLAVRDLRIENYLYLRLAAPVATNRLLKSKIRAVRRGRRI